MATPTAAELAALNAATGNILFTRIARLRLFFPVSTPGDYTHTTSNEVTINGIDSPDEPGMRIRFTITKTAEKEPNPGEFIITNLSPERRAAVQFKGIKVLFEAGYESTGYARLFAGDVRTADSTKNGPDWETKIRCGDGERAYVHASISESFEAGVTVGDVVKSCAAAFGLPLGNTAAQAAKLKTVLYGGWVAHGPASTALEEILRAVGYRFFVHDEQLQIVGANDHIATTIPEVSPQSGLIGSPELGSPEKKGGPATLQFRSLILPGARPAGLVSVRSARHTGIFKWKKAVHTGDTRGPEWYTAHEATAVSGAAVQP